MLLSYLTSQNKVKSQCTALPYKTIIRCLDGRFSVKNGVCQHISYSAEFLTARFVMMMHLSRLKDGSLFHFCVVYMTVEQWSPDTAAVEGHGLYRTAEALYSCCFSIVHRCFTLNTTKAFLHFFSSCWVRWACFTSLFDTFGWILWPSLECYDSRCLLNIDIWGCLGSFHITTASQIYTCRDNLDGFYCTLHAR